MSECMKNQDKIYEQINNTIKEFVEGDLNDQISAVKQLSVILEELPENLGSCKGMKEPLEKVVKWLNVFEDQNRLQKVITVNLTQNFLHIASSIKHLETAFKAKNFKKAGRHASDIMTMILGPVEAEEDEKKQPELLLLTAW